MWKQTRTAALIILSIGIALLFFLFAPAAGEWGASSPEAKVLFVGDIMLGRHVERLWERGTYPFVHMDEHLHAYDLTVGNFEASVPETHVPTEDFAMRFSVKKEYLKHLGELGFDILSLANNHSTDFGMSGWKHTRARCTEYGIECPGLVASVGDESVRIVSIDGIHVGFIFLNETFGKLSVEDVKAQMQYLNEHADMQVAYVHWGEEYELLHNNGQQVLAHGLVDLGADAVMGHHPHVIQDVEIYKDAPIFYSLGNFVFDQYFSADVLEGLLVEMRIHGEDVDFNLKVLTSEKGASQPRFIETEREQDIFARIFRNVASDPRIDAISGTISIKH